VEALGGKDWAIRYRAAEVLGEMGARAAIKPLIERLSDSDEAVRYRAAWALGRMGAREAIPSLIERLKETDDDIKIAVSRALGEIGASSAIEALATMLQEDRFRVREAAIWALGKIDSPDVGWALLQALRDREPVLRGMAASSLAKRALLSREAAILLLDTWQAWFALAIEDAMTLDEARGERWRDALVGWTRQMRDLFARARAEGSSEEALFSRYEEEESSSLRASQDWGWWRSRFTRDIGTLLDKIRQQRALWESAVSREKKAAASRLWSIEDAMASMLLVFLPERLQRFADVAEDVLFG
jgi:hypothetical protein